MAKKNTGLLVWGGTIFLALLIFGGAVYISKSWQQEEDIPALPPVHVVAAEPEEAPVKLEEQTAPVEEPFVLPDMPVKEVVASEAATLEDLLDGQDFTMALTSPAFEAGRRLPLDYTCYRSNTSPPLQWTNVPAGTKSFVLVMAMQRPGEKARMHWVVYNIPSEDRGVPVNRPKQSALDRGMRQTINAFGSAGYAGPCDPKGRIPYVFYIFALDTPPGASGDVDRVEAETVFGTMRGHILGAGKFAVQHYLRAGQ